VATTPDEIPDGIVLRRHLELRGRAWGLPVRRGLLCALALFPLLALLDVFGQGAVTTSARNGDATLTVDSPETVRGGVLFTTRLTVETRTELSGAQLALDGGWFDGMQVNSIVPQPSQESSRDGRVVLGLGRIPAHRRVSYYIGFQADPTTIGSRTQDVRLQKDGRTLLTVERTIKVLP
jgi:hypothetical protein